MVRGRPVRLAALALAVVGWALPSPLTPPGVARGHVDVPAVWPTPRQVHETGEGFAIPGTVALVTGPRTDGPAAGAARAALSAAGARIVAAHAGLPPPRVPLTVYVGGRASAAALRRLGVDGPAGLAAGGYVLASGVDRGAAVVVLSGIDPAGTFYAAQTLRQLVVARAGRSWLPSVTVRDWPAFRLRGLIEGFYGTPWSAGARLAQLDFLGRTKQNVYVYAPKDDPYLRERWRDAYPAAELSGLRRLVQRAGDDHVRFVYALSPGLSVCYSSDADERALIAKLQSMYDAGARSFAIPFDDISYTTWSCPQDAATFGAGPAAAAYAQSTLLNAIQDDFIATHPGVDRLQTVPTEYHGLDGTAYQRTLARDLDPAVVVEWTGIDVVSSEITAGQAAGARAVYGHDILLWDNYPVNDYAPDRLMLGPYLGRDPGLAGEVLGVTVNPMPEAAASRIAMFTSGDFLWNPSRYDPNRAWLASVQDAGGAGAGALRVLAENSRSSLLARLDSGDGEPESPELASLAPAFLDAYRSGGDLDGAAAPLDAYLARMARVPDALGRALRGDMLWSEVRPWAVKLGLYGQAGEQAVAMLRAERAGDADGAARERTALTATMARLAGMNDHAVCVDVCDPFLDAALAA